MTTTRKYNIPPQDLIDARNQVIVCITIHYVNIAKTIGINIRKRDTLDLDYNDVLQHYIQQSTPKADKILIGYSSR